jgi:hydroxymethylpyrimidine pyrophosphatase-like HAD family hydrolase
MTSENDGKIPDRASESAPHEPLLVSNLLNDLSALGPLLLTEIRQASWLNAYLLAGGMNQIIEDYLHPDPYFLGKAAGHMARMRAPVGPLAAGTARSLAASISFLRCRQGAAARVGSRQAELAVLVQQLADMVACPADATPTVQEKMLASAEVFVLSMAHFPLALLREVLRLPSCFRSFDQQPADLDRIALEFAQRWPDRHTPVLVVGMRSSGSYLAPLYGAFLRGRGYRNVRTVTVRPGRWLWPHEQSLLKSIIRRRGLVLLTDDPPVSGSTLAESAESLERVGVPSRSIVMLLQLFGSSDVPPPRLQKYASILLPWNDWAIHALLEPAVVQTALANLLAPTRTVSAVKRLPLEPRQWERGHAHALYQVRLVDQVSGRHREQIVYVKGAGLGYFGEHALAIGRALGPFLPEVYGVKGGLVFREWLPEEQRLAPSESSGESERAAEMIAYVQARHHALRVEEDVSLRLIGRLPAWEAACNLLGQAFGRGWMFARLPIVDPVVKRLLHCTDLSVIDGSMTPEYWFTKEGDARRLLKVDFYERAFSNRDLSCYDPVFDVASMAASIDLAGTDMSGRGLGLPRLLHDTFENSMATPIGTERWLLYQLVHLSSLQRNQIGERPEVRRALSRALQRYFAEIYFHDLPIPTTGALCALDIDGVLETGHLGFPSLSPAGASTLRALNLHGYRPILATGRSISEIRERCAAYHLAGGIAEYGAVAYNHGTGKVRQLLSEGDCHALDQLRTTLGTFSGVFLDSDYRYAIRAYQLDSAGKRHGLNPELVANALASAEVGQKIRPITGQAQTDFMIDGVDKGTGLRSLVADLNQGRIAAGGKPLAFAVGDTFSDLPMFELSSMAFAPANADAQVRSSNIKVLKRPYQSGLALAAARLLGHAPGNCHICQMVPLSSNTDLFLATLAAQERGTWGIAARALQLTIRVWRSQRTYEERPIRSRTNRSENEHVPTTRINV